MAIDRKKWSSGPMVEALKAMFLVENGSSGLGKRTKAFERNPAYTGSDPNVPILWPMEASETRNFGKSQRSSGPRYFLNNKEL